VASRSITRPLISGRSAAPHSHARRNQPAFELLPVDKVQHWLWAEPTATLAARARSVLACSAATWKLLLWPLAAAAPARRPGPRCRRAHRARRLAGEAGSASGWPVARLVDTPWTRLPAGVMTCQPVRRCGPDPAQPRARRRRRLAVQQSFDLRVAGAVLAISHSGFILADRHAQRWAVHRDLPQCTSRDGTGAERQGAAVRRPQ
jgi:hypothetical protein